MLKREYKIYLRYFYLGIILIILIFFVFDYCPQMGEMSKLSAKINIVKNSIKTLSADEKKEQQQKVEYELNKLDQQYEVVKAAAEEVKAQATIERNIPLVTLQVEDLANLSKIELTLIKPLVSEDESLHEILPIEIGFQSTYERLIDFIILLEESPLLLSARDLIITRNEASYPALDVKLVLDVLFHAPEDEDASQENGDINQ